MSSITYDKYWHIINHVTRLLGLHNITGYDHMRHHFVLLAYSVDKAYYGSEYCSLMENVLCLFELYLILQNIL